MFRVEVSDVSFITKIVEAVATILDEATFHVTSKGIKLLSMDPSHLAMIDLDIPGEAFSSYVCDEAISICVNVQDLLKFIKRAGGESLVILLDEERRRLNLEFSIGEYKRVFTITTLEEREEKTPIPRMTFDAHIGLSSLRLHEAVRDAKLVSEYVKFEAGSDRLIIRAEGDTMSTATTLGQAELEELDVRREAKATYSVAYLSDMVRAGKEASDSVVIEFSTDKPIKLDFRPYTGKLVYYLAPCIGV